jgi:hypothetical protein
MSHNEGEVSGTKVVFGIIGFILLMFFLDWVVAGNNFFMYKYFAPKQAEAERQVYKHTNTYVQGNVQRLAELCSSLKDPNTTDGHRAMVNDTIAHEFADWNLQDVPDYLQSCLANSHN